MWVFTTEGFVSVVLARKDGGRSRLLDPDTLNVRARSLRHLQNLRERYPQLAPFKPFITKGTDYAARMIVPKSVWATVAAQLVLDLDYGNFKNAVSDRKRTEVAYKTGLGRVWSIMYGFQGGVSDRGAGDVGLFDWYSASPRADDGDDCRLCDGSELCSNCDGDGCTECERTGSCECSRGTPRPYDFATQRVEDLKLRRRVLQETVNPRRYFPDLRGASKGVEREILEPHVEWNVDHKHLAILRPQRVGQSAEVLIVGYRPKAGPAKGVAILANASGWRRGRDAARDAAAAGMFDKIPRSRLRLERVTWGRIKDAEGRTLPVFDLGVLSQLGGAMTEKKTIDGGVSAKANPARAGNTGPLVEDASVVGGNDAQTGAPVIRPKTSAGTADESVNPTDQREKA